MQNSNLEETLEYLIPYQEKQKEKRKTILLVASVIAGLGLLGLICFLIAKNGFSVESLLSTILAIFSIVISILFYFKADSTSSKFYESSYNFMKEQSMLLGRIEERFGAKFDNINTTLEHMSIKTSEIVEKESEKGTLIKQFEEKSQITQKDKEEFLNALTRKDTEINNLRKELNNFRCLDEYTVKSSNQFTIEENILRNIFAGLAVEDFKKILEEGYVDASGLSVGAIQYLVQKKYIDLDGKIINEKRFSKFLEDEIFRMSRQRHINRLGKNG